MTIVGLDGGQIFVRMPQWEYLKVVKAIANMDSDDSEEN